ncbi:MAG: ATP-binding protein [Rhodocyclaceae bacterium]
MKWPRTLFGQIALTLFIGFLAVQLTGLWLMLDDRGRLNYRLLAEYAAQRMGGIAAVLEDAAPAERPRLVQALSAPPTTALLDIPWVRDKADTSATARAFVRQASRALPHALDIQLLALERIDPVMLELHPRRNGDLRARAEAERPDAPRPRLLPRRYVAQVRLSDGTVVTFSHYLPVPDADRPYRVIALLALLGISVAGLSIWAVRRLTRPLAKFSQAASGLARNLDQAPLPEGGPQEIRQAAQAFNTMQRDLKRLIDTRAQALSAVSHDLRLPITRMRLRLEGDIAPALRERMDNDLAEMDSMIGHTLDFLRAGSNSEAPVLVDIDALVDSVAEDMEELGATLTREGAARRPLSARPHALRRCIANLLDNARKYGGGHITVRIEDSDRAVRIVIADEGPGIAPHDIAKVFEPYFRVESSRARHTGGVGLGLPIAKAIVEAHGGTLTLASPLGHGVVVTVTLPR